MERILVAPNEATVELSLECILRNPFNQPTTTNLWLMIPSLFVGGSVEADFVRRSKILKLVSPSLA